MELPKALGIGDDPLAIYLNDHLAGATAGMQLARRAAAKNRANDYGPALAELAQEIEQDRAALEDLMRRLDVGRDRLKLLVSWGAEKAGRAKFNGRPLRYSPLSRLEEIELVLLGVHGKLALWRALRQIAAGDARLHDEELETLIKRGESQRGRLERQRLRAAHDALGG
jgi:hypothetical protein